MDIKPTPFSEAKQNIGYSPSYGNLTPEQRWIYLNWLKDVRQTVDIGYVFIFFYGLERHLLSGNYKDAIDVILLLRKYHKNLSFQSYSLDSMLFSTLINKDINLLDKILLTLDDEHPTNLVLISKYLMKKDLTCEEIIHLSSVAGFKNKGYINKYPELFKQKLSDKFKAEFGKDSYPIYKLSGKFENTIDFMFANHSIDYSKVSYKLPSIIDSKEFKESIYNILLSAHQDVKVELSQMKKLGNAPIPKVSSKNSLSNDNFDSFCPYCNKDLDTPPKKKKKCPYCGNFIYIRSSKDLFSRTCLTEDEALATDELSHLKDYGINNEDLLNKYILINKDVESKYSYSDTCMRIYEELLNKVEFSHKGYIYFKMALLNYKRGKEFISYLKIEHKHNLLELKNKGYKRVIISTKHCCEKCQKLKNKEMLIDDALMDEPLPNINCTREVEKGKAGWCACSYTIIEINNYL